MAPLSVRVWKDCIIFHLTWPLDGARSYVVPAKDPTLFTEMLEHTETGFAYLDTNQVRHWVYWGPKPNGAELYETGTNPPTPAPPIADLAKAVVATGPVDPAKPVTP